MFLDLKSLSQLKLPAALRQAQVVVEVVSVSDCLLLFTKDVKRRFNAPQIAEGFSKSK